MLELGKFSTKLHKSFAPLINRTKIDKVYVRKKRGTFYLFNKISKHKKGRILRENFSI